jgi:hypothetical protein
MDYSVARGHDPLAVALGNASLLGVGYLMLGRRALAAATGLVTVVLLVILATVARSLWLEVVVLVWWAALVGHGWLLAGRGGRPAAVRTPRLVALGITVVVVAAVTLLRLDAAGIERSVTQARRDGDCAQATRALDRLWFGHRLADAPLTARLDDTTEACQRLRAAAARLTVGLTGDTGALRAGFAGLAGVLATLPGHQAMVGTTLDRFLAGLPTANPCRTVTVTDWLRGRRATHDELDRAAGAVTRTAPAALVGCGDALVARQDWRPALARYRQVLDLYPGSPFTARAQQGVTRATLAIELAHVRDLLAGPTDTQPDYCTKPAKYGGAPAYHRGVDLALIYGNDGYAARLPAAWQTTDVTKAVLVVCAGDVRQGAAVRTCQYQGKPFPDFPVDVTFHKITIPVKAYELRTGRVVFDGNVVINGTSCPEVLSYTGFGVDVGPPSDTYVTASNTAVRAAFAGLLAP